MGVTIHYSGQLADRDRQRQLCREMADICKSMEWQLFRVNEEYINMVDDALENGIFL